MILDGVIQLAISKVKSKSITLNISAVGFENDIQELYNSINISNGKTIVSNFSPIQNSPYYQISIQIEYDIKSLVKRYSSIIREYNISGVLSYSPIIEKIYGKIPNRINLYFIDEIVNYIDSYDIDSIIEQGLLGSDNIYLTASTTYAAEHIDVIDNVEVKMSLEGETYSRAGCTSIYVDNMVMKKVVKNYNVIVPTKECGVEKIGVEFNIMDLNARIEITTSVFCTVFSIDYLSFETSSEYHPPDYIYAG